MPMTPVIIIATIFFLFVVLFPTATADLPKFCKAPAFRNGKGCPISTWAASPHDPATVHVSMTLDYSTSYLPGSTAAVFSIPQHSTCPENISFHFITTTHAHPFLHLNSTITSTFPFLRFQLYHFNPTLVNHLISSSIRRALDQPLNYARIYLANIFPNTVNRVIYFDSDLIIRRIYELGSLTPFLLVFAEKVERVEHLWNQHGLGGDNVEGLCRDLHPGPVSLLHWSGKG